MARNILAEKQCIYFFKGNPTPAPHSITDNLQNLTLRLPD